MARISVHGLVLAACSGIAVGQSFPTKPVRIIVGTATGGGVDTISRIVATKLTERWARAH